MHTKSITPNFRYTRVTPMTQGTQIMPGWKPGPSTTMMRKEQF